MPPNPPATHPLPRPGLAPRTTAGEGFFVSYRHCLRWVPLFLIITAWIFATPSAAISATATPSPTWEKAGAAYQAGDWKTAAEAPVSQRATH